MTLLDDIIEMASDNKEPIGNLLRKCLILERQLKNEKFRAWLDQELDGYDRENPDEFPPYRVFNCVNKGDFYGMTVKMSGQPISLHVMDERDRKMLETVHLHQPAASYESRPNQDSDAGLPWNPYLIVKYQTKIYRNGEPALMRAWQEIPGSILVGLLEQVRTRVLRFALELKDALPDEATNIADVPPASIERNVVNNIFNGDVVFANNIEYTNNIVKQNVSVGDFTSLSHALQQIGVSPEGIKALQADMTADGAPKDKDLGGKVKGWVADIGKYVGKEGVKVGVEVAKRAAIKWIMQHYGLDI